MENKIKRLEFIQAVVARMSGNSFFIKGWCITLVSGLLSLAAKDGNKKFMIVVFFPVVMFWLLDAYFLRQERLFRQKYEEVANSVAPDNFSMDISTVEKRVAPWLRVAFSKTMVLFYGTMLVAMSVAIFILWS